MGTTPIFLHHNGHWMNSQSYTDYDVSGIVVNNDCSFGVLCDLIADKLKINLAAKNLIIKYQVKDAYPSMEIETDSSLKFYLELKQREPDCTKLPLCITITRNEVSNFAVMEHEHNCHVQPLSFMIPEFSFGSDKGKETFVDFAKSAANAMLAQVEDTAAQLEIPTKNGCVANMPPPGMYGLMMEKMYETKKELQMTLSTFALQQKFQYKVVKSCPKQYYIRCIDDACNWYIKASSVGDSTFFKIRSTEAQHTCSLDIRMNEQRQATSKLVAECIKPKFSSIKTSYKPADIIRDMKDDYGINLSYKKAWRSKREALDEVQGNPTESYELIPRYFELLCKSNPGSVVKLKTTEDKHFMYLFMSLSASIKGWQHCRPIIVVDGTFLKGSYGGTLITASAQDANSHILPLAFGVVDSENDSSYEWFFQNLKSTLCARPNLCFVTDRHESIANALKKVYPGASHCVCIYHLSKNIKTNYRKNSDVVKHAFESAARAYTLEEFEHHMDVLKKANNDVIPYLKDVVGYHRWARAHCLSNRFLTMTSNAAESINSATKVARELPIITLLESLRSLQQEWNVKNGAEARNTFTALMKRGHQMLEENYRIAGCMTVHKASDRIYKVSSGQRFYVVDLAKKVCSCNKFQMDELPCPHALSVLRGNNEDPLPYCSWYYRKESMLATYEETVFPVEGDILEKDSAEMSPNTVLPPFGKSKSGRRRKKRLISGWEYRWKTRCGKCGEKGHNVKTCHNPPKM